MSSVTDTILMFDMGQDEDERMKEVNSFLAEHHVRGEFVLLNTTNGADGQLCYGGDKHLQANVAVGAFNYLPIDEFLDHLRTKVNWDRSFAFVQVALQDEHDHGFTFIEILKTF